MENNRRHPFIVAANIKKIIDQDGSDEDIAGYISEEGYSQDEISKMPIPRNVENIAGVLTLSEKAGKVLANAPGLPGEIVRNPKLVEALAPIAGQITGNIAGAAIGASGGPVGVGIGSEVLGTAGATIGEAAAQAIKFMRGEVVSPDEARKEILHTGAIAGITESLFGRYSPGGALLEQFGKGLSKLSSEYLPGIAAKVAQATSGKVTPEQFMELAKRDARKVLNLKNLGKSIDPAVVYKAQEGLSLMIRNANKEYAAIVRPLQKNNSLFTEIKPFADDFNTLMKEFGFVDEKGRIQRGLLNIVNDSKFLKKLFKDIKGFAGAKAKNKTVKEVVESVEGYFGEITSREVVKKTIKVPATTINFNDLLKTRNELDTLISYPKGTDVVPASGKLDALLKSFRAKVNEELGILGGDAFRQVNNEYSNAKKLFDDLYGVLKNSNTAEGALENVIKTSRQQQRFRLQDMNNRLPQNLRFMDDLEDFALAQRFKDEGFNMLRAGIIGSILGVPSLAAAGPVGVIAGFGGAYFSTTPRGIGLTIQAAQDLSRIMAKYSNQIRNAGGAVNPTILRSFLSEALSSQSSQSGNTQQ